MNDPRRYFYLEFLKPDGSRVPILKAQYITSPSVTLNTLLHPVWFAFRSISFEGIVINRVCIVTEVNTPPDKKYPVITLRFATYDEIVRYWSSA